MWDLSADKNMKKLVEDFYSDKKIISAVCMALLGYYRQQIKMEIQY
jgi:hypothetical protein